MILFKNSFKLGYPSNECRGIPMLMVWEKFQIFKNIIHFIPVFMMDCFPRRKATVQMLRHYKAVFVSFTTAIRKRVLFAKKYFHIPIARWITIANPTPSFQTSFPIRTIFASSRPLIKTFFEDFIILPTDFALNIDFQKFIRFLFSHKYIISFWSEQVKVLEVKNAISARTFMCLNT